MNYIYMCFIDDFCSAHCQLLSMFFFLRGFFFYPCRLLLLHCFALGRRTSRSLLLFLPLLSYLTIFGLDALFLLFSCPSFLYKVEMYILVVIALYLHLLLLFFFCFSPVQCVRVRVGDLF